MVALLVPRQMCPSLIGPFTQLTRVGLLIRVALQMLAKIAALRKIPTTHLTLVGLVAGVGPLVHLHLAPITKELVTEVALVRPLPGVDQLVDFELLPVGQGFTALITRMAVGALFLVLWRGDTSWC